MVVGTNELLLGAAGHIVSYCWTEQRVIRLSLLSRCKTFFALSGRKTNVDSNERSGNPAPFTSLVFKYFYDAGVLCRSTSFFRLLLVLTARRRQLPKLPILVKETRVCNRSFTNVFLLEAPLTAADRYLGSEHAS